MTTHFNKSLWTNLIAATCVVIGLFLTEPLRTPILSIGLFALSGAITNWLAIHMLFEKIPGLYGSGVIPARFEDFKLAIRSLIMEQFFTREHVNMFFEDTKNSGINSDFDFGPIIDKMDLKLAFEGLVSVIMDSSFGGMLGMLGGASALDPLKEPFAAKMKSTFMKIVQSEYFHDNIRSQLVLTISSEKIHTKIEAMVQKRLDELTPQMVKDIIQKMIRDHLGWLVVWGGIFGGLIGLATGLLMGSSSSAWFSF